MTTRSADEAEPPSARWRHFTVKVMPDANHGLLEVRTGEGGEELPIERFSPKFHPLVVDWIASHFLP